MGIYEGLKDAAGILKEAGKIEQYRQILEVQEKLLEMQRQISELETENKTLKEKLDIKGQLMFENNSYWLVQDGKKDGPYCSCCWDDNRKTIRMQPCGNPAYFSCPKCENKTVKIYADSSGRGANPLHVYRPDYT